MNHVKQQFIGFVSLQKCKITYTSWFEKTQTDLLTNKFLKFATHCRISPGKFLLFHQYEFSCLAFGYVVEKRTKKNEKSGKNDFENRFQYSE